MLCDQYAMYINQRGQKIIKTEEKLMMTCASRTLLNKTSLKNILLWLTVDLPADCRKHTTKCDQYISYYAITFNQVHF